MKTRLLLGIAVFLGLLALLASYSYLVETRWLEVTHHNISLPVRAPLKVAHLTDLHIRTIGSLERKILAVLNQERPDLILVTGDMVAENGNYGLAGEFLNLLKAPLGVWGVEGNWEHWTSANETNRSLASHSNMPLLRNENRRVREDVWLVGLDDALAGNPDLDSAFDGKPADALCVALFHSPAYFSKIAGKCRLNLSGHTHGGQIRLPLWGPVWLPPESGSFVSGWYESKGSKMYVSRGIGTSVIDARLFCRPEVAIIEVRGSGE